MRISTLMAMFALVTSIFPGYAAAAVDIRAEIEPVRCTPGPHTSVTLSRDGSGPNGLAPYIVTVDDRIVSRGYLGRQGLIRTGFPLPAKPTKVTVTSDTTVIATWALTPTC